MGDYQTYLAGSKGFVYAVVDPMGSGYQGDVWRFAMYHGFGGREAQTTIEVIWK